MMTNKITKVSEVEREALRLILTQVDENGSVDRAVATACVAGIPRRGIVIHGLARKGLIEVSDRVVLLPAGTKIADDAARRHAEQDERDRVAKEIARIAEALRWAVAAGDITSAEYYARTFPAARERFHVWTPAGDVLWVDARTDAQYGGPPTDADRCVLLSANDALRDDDRGAACRAAAAVFEYVARPHTNKLPYIGQWFNLPEERRGVARIAKAVAARVEDAKTRRETLAAAVAQGGAEWAMNQYGEWSIIADNVARAFTRVAKVAANKPEDLNAVQEEIAAVREEAERDLIRHRPWAHNSTCPITDLMNLFRADGLAEVVQFANRLL